MRTRPILLSKTCPYCGARSQAEAKMPIPANLPVVEFNLDDLGALIRKQSLSQLLALVELLPYKTFACVKCAAEYRLESRSARELVGAMLTSLRPVLAPVPAPKARKTTARPAFSPARAAPDRSPTPAPAAEPASADWESESLDDLFDYTIDEKL